MKINNKWFVLVELFVALMITTMIISTFLLYKNSFDVKAKELIFLKNSFDNLSVVTNLIFSVWRNSYGIDYDNTINNWDLDSLTLYNSKNEDSSITFYVKQDLSYDLSRIYLKNNKTWVEKALWPSSLFITKFNIIEITDNPNIHNTRSIQPYIKLDISWRKRSPKEVSIQDKDYLLFPKSEVNLDTSFVISNYTYSSLKK